VFIFHVVGNFWIFLVRFWDDCWNFVCYCIWICWLICGFLFACGNRLF
jgi:hypothetical protein